MVHPMKSLASVGLSQARPNELKLVLKEAFQNKISQCMHDEINIIDFPFQFNCFYGVDPQTIGVLTLNYCTNMY